MVGKKPWIRVDRMTSLVDSPINIMIFDVEPQIEVTIKAHRVVEGERIFHFSSNATFISDDKGQVDLNIQAPISGTYSCTDGMGLFWSLEVSKIVEKNEKLTSNSSSETLPPQIFTLSLVVDEQVVNEIQIERLWKADNILRKSIRENGLIATLFSNKDGQPRPAVIMLGGSGGGLNEFQGSLLASHGFTVLVLAYFGIDHLPQSLVEIPLEYIETAIEWIKKCPEAQKGWLGIHGVSRGSELALLSASFFHDIKAVVSLNGSSILFSGIVPWTEEETLPPAWLYKGEPVPYAAPFNPIQAAMECRAMAQNRTGDPIAKWYKALTADPVIVDKATIHVENINGPILLISGEEDVTLAFSKKAIERLNNHSFKESYNHLIYPDAGHSIGIPYVFFNGKQKEATARASADSWRKTIEFFRESFSRYEQGGIDDSGVFFNL
ncbi:acyl-CoA thioesterase/bile acid-CoA:amino acid N-acyltransferase family protein [Falsibacillus pallidus]|uniref:acyl-CoA thioesterase/bile acid-CoA:amino acid N-acyltransferase family protein n=1 Tax=Falsibacillus pallidus TaxID=493781 RepID=UPI003D97B2BF